MRPALRIAIVTPRYLPHTGGIERVVAQVAPRVAADGHHVEVLTQARDRRLPRRELRDGLTIRRFVSAPTGNHLAVAPSLLAFLHAHAGRYDVIHAHNYHAFPALAAALSPRGPLVFSPHYHGTGHAPLRRALHVPYRLCGRAIFRRAEAVICVSEAEALLVRRHFGDSVPRMQVIPNGVDVEALRHAAPMPAPGTLILCVGRLERYKQVDRAVRAMVHLEGRFTLAIVGDGPEQQPLRALCARLGVADRVRFLGRIEDHLLARWLRAAAVYVNLSCHEAYGITVVEALAAGAQVVASRIPAFVEHARGAHSGRISLVPVEAPASAVAAAIRAASERTPTTAEEGPYPSWDAAAAQTLRVYRQVAGR